MNLVSSFVVWCAMHTVTLAALSLAFILGSVWGMWCQFNADDKKSPSSVTADKGQA